MPRMRKCLTCGKLSPFPECDDCLDARVEASYDPNDHCTSADHTMTRSEQRHFEAVQRLSR